MRKLHLCQMCCRQRLGAKRIAEFTQEPLSRRIPHRGGQPQLLAGAERRLPGLAALLPALLHRCEDMYGSMVEDRRCGRVLQKASQSPVPEDWKEQLAKAVEELPDDGSVHELIRTVASLSPDRARTLIQVLEEEVSVMEDVVDREALERLKRLRREHQSELKALSAGARQTRIAALEMNTELMQLYPAFDWEAYHNDPNYLQQLVLDRVDADRQEELAKVEETIEQNQVEKRFLMAEIKELREQRAVLQRRLDEGCELDLQEEIDKARRENQLLRDHYAHLCSLADQQERRHSAGSSSYGY